MENELILALPGRHCTITLIKLNDATDIHNNPVQTLRYAPHYLSRVSGKLFIIESAVDAKALVIKAEAPDCDDITVILERGRVVIETLGYEVRYAYCEAKNAHKTLRGLFDKPGSLFTMVNNWGDLGRGANISEAFYLREIDAAADTGADALQIDDGWQIGSSSQARIMDENGVYTGYHAFDGDFWLTDTVKFPNGLKRICDYASAKGVVMGLWFAPDSRNHFANFARDLAVIKNAYSEGFRCFKLDMVVIKDREDRRIFRSFMKSVRDLGPDVSVQIDVTGAVPRLGFTDGTDLGILFAENRYCRKDDYNPASTLANLWQLSRYIPAQVFQFEIPNRRKNTQDYEHGDPLAPILYSADYQFASVMVSNPLLWMEIQHLDGEDREQMKPLIALWKRIRGDIAASDIEPIGRNADGCDACGFFVRGKERSYLIALSGCAGAGSVEAAAGTPVNAELLCASCACSCIEKDGILTATLASARAYAVFLIK